MLSGYLVLEEAHVTRLSVLQHIVLLMCISTIVYGVRGSTIFSKETSWPNQVNRLLPGVIVPEIDDDYLDSLG